MLSEILKKRLIEEHFEWDGDRKYTRKQDVLLGGNSVVIVNGQRIQQSPQKAQLVMIIEDYGQSCMSSLDDSDMQFFNLVSFKQGLLVEDGAEEQNSREEIVFFRDSEESGLLTTIQNFLNSV